MAKKADVKNTRVIPAGKVQENFNILADLLEQVKDIAASQNVSRAEIYNRAIERYIAAYIKKNGKIKPRSRGEGLL